jgi:tetratricopeptide (TPR) repeat protein
MIVRDEAGVIRRCLDSVRPLIDTWVIVDTGSVDGTADVIRDHLRDLPGEIHERPWRDFGHNRTEALELARSKADYVLVIDADEVLEVEPGFRLPPLDLDSYRILTRYSGHSYHRIQLVRSDLGFRYEGVLHEHLTSDHAKTEGTLAGVVNVPRSDGARSRDPAKYEKDAEILERALERDPGDTRSTFYLAQSFRDAGMLERAIAAYERRAAMGGWAEEVWYSLFQVGVLRQRLGAPTALVLEAHLRAHQYQPRRAEPLCALSSYHRGRAEYALAHLFARPIAHCPRPDDGLFVDDALYEWRALDEYAIAAYYTGDHPAALAANDELLGSGKLPESERARVIRNREFCIQALGPAPKRGPRGPGGLPPRKRSRRRR